MVNEITTDRRIARELRNARVNAGYTQKQMGLMAGKAPQTVASWECGKAQPNIQTFLFMCRKYGITDIFREFHFIFDEFGDADLKLEVSKVPYHYEMFGLTADEAALLKKYRILTRRNKKLVLELIKSITKEEDEEEDSETEESKAEESKTEKPKPEESKAEESKTEKPETEESKVEESKTEETETEESKAEESKTEKPETEESKTEESKVEESKAEESKVEESETEEPSTKKTRAKKARKKKIHGKELQPKAEQLQM